LAHTLDTTPAALALRWVMQQTAVATVLMGAKRASQVVENLGAVDLQIDEDESAKMVQMFEGD
jgi:aryl-alcohol dehydrogenase-like predicted oxidoreductase